MTATASEQLTHLSARLHHDFTDPKLLTLALTHRSFCAENDNAVSNERLELLGDSVVGLAVTDHLYRTLPDRDEGVLAKIRSSVVSEPALAEAAEAMGLGEVVLLGRGELLSGGQAKPSILSDAFEAVIGALYLDAGYATAARAVVQLLSAHIEEATVGPGGHDYKTRLQELTAHRFERAPLYVLTESGPEHGKRFHATVMIDDDALGTGVGTSKKRAEQAAAQAAWDALTGETTVLELPEVEVLRRDLEREVVEKKVKAVEAKSMAALARYKNRKSFTSQLEGVKFCAVTRKGVRLLIELDNEQTLVITVGNGSLRKISGKEKNLPAAEITIAFMQGGSLIYVMSGPGGDFVVVPTENVETAIPEFDHLGFDPVEIPISWGLFGELLIRRPSNLKHFLTDQTIMTGIGDIYADEILFNAGVRHDRRSESLSSQEVRRLYRAVVETLHDAIKYRGTSLPENGYVDLYGKPGEYHPQVYGRDGQRSPRSRNFIQKVKFEGHWTYFCDTQV